MQLDYLYFLTKIGLTNGWQCSFGMELIVIKELMLFLDVFQI